LVQLRFFPVVVPAVVKRVFGKELLRHTTHETSTGAPAEREIPSLNLSVRLKKLLPKLLFLTN